MSECLISNSSIEQNNCVLPETLQVLTDNQRYSFMGIFIIISILSLTGNFAVIYSIPKKKCRCIQKACIVSLALSDLFSTIIIATNNLETFSHELLIWTLGPFLCSFIPMCQMTGILASSIALLLIAMDRYRSVIHAFSKRWNPSLDKCIGVMMAFWLSSFALSYPLYDYFIQEDVIIVYVNNGTIEEVKDFVCVSFYKSKMRTYFIAMVIIIFLPLLVVFVWFYYNIAALVWHHRKPLLGRFHNSSKSHPVSQKGIDNIRVEKKIRTFKVIVTLMMVFIICRLPYFTIYILKLSLRTNEFGLWTWTLNYVFTALHIVNCSLNPLLYTFLNPTLAFLVKFKRAIHTFVREICCFCFAKSDFEDFEKDNPFLVKY